MQTSTNTVRPVVDLSDENPGLFNERFSEREYPFADPYQRGYKNTSSAKDEILTSFRLMKDARCNILLLFGPIAFIGSSSGWIGEALCFCFSGLALIPCAERLSFVTEQVAEHTNETIGALLNATFGNAPEFLISSAALRSGFYRVVQLTLLGSMLTNLLFVFGLSCLVGGLQWQVQELRITSGNVSIGMLLTAAMGLILPAALKLGNESRATNFTQADEETMDESSFPSASDIGFSRVNALVMVIGYVSYLIFQLGTHKEEFDYEGDEYAVFGGGHNVVRTPHFDTPRRKSSPRRNLFCRTHCFIMRYCPDVRVPRTRRNNPERFFAGTRDLELSEIVDISIPDKPLPLLSPSTRSIINRSEENSRSDNNTLSDKSGEGDNDELIQALAKPYKDHSSDQADAEEDELLSIPEEIMSMRMGLVWLGIVTVAISILSDIIVETIDGFAIKSKMSEVFTSVIIIPYFSNIAEQVSAVIFAYRNKMDLCIGVTVGSAIQIGQFVMPGCVLVAWAMDRSMTLYFRGYETICLLLGVLCVAAVLQGGTTNWLVGVFLVGVYIQIAAGFAFHEIEDLSKDAES